MSGFSLEDVSHAFGDHQIIRNVSFAVQAGEIVCLLGPSGCGKTTLLRLAAGLEPLQKGRTVIGNAVAADAGRGAETPPERRGVGLMFQDYALFPHLTVFENIIFGVAGAGRGKLQAVEMAMARMGIDGLRDAYPHTLSGGQQQRVALLRALAPEPRVLLLDEPFSDLDVNLRAQVREETLGLLKETGIATLMVTHDPEEAMFMGDRILVMNRGRIEQTGSPREIYQFPATEFVARFVGRTNILPGIVLDPGYDEVMTSIGPISCLSMRGLQPGTDAFISIRPESFEINMSGPLTAKVCQTSYVGKSLALVVEILGGIGTGWHLLVNANPNQRIDVGEEIRFRVIPDFVTVIEDPLSNGE